jgi:hypothetical protein
MRVPAMFWRYERKNGMHVDVQHDAENHTFYAINAGKVSTLDYEPIGKKKLDY